MANFWELAAGRALDFSNRFFHTALVYDMQFDPKIQNGPILAHTGYTDFSPWGKKGYFKISLNLKLKEGNTFFEGSVCR